MLSRLPPTRWRVVERGRRLVTIDTTTGEGIGLGAILPETNLDARPRDHQPRPAQRATLAAPAKASVPIVKDSSRPVAVSATRSALPALSPASQNNANKMILLSVAAIFLLFMLIFSGAWVFVAVALFFAPVRQAILPPIWSRIKAWLQSP
jgi:hypothetical protein